MGNNGVDGTTVRTPVFPNGPSLCFLWTADHDLEAGMRPDPLTTRPQNGPSTTDQIWVNYTLHQPCMMPVLRATIFILKGVVHRLPRCQKKSVLQWEWGLGPQFRTLPKPGINRTTITKFYDELKYFVHNDVRLEGICEKYNLTVNCRSWCYFTSSFQMRVTQSHPTVANNITFVSRQCDEIDWKPYSS